MGVICNGYQAQPLLIFLLIKDTTTPVVPSIIII